MGKKEKMSVLVIVMVRDCRLHYMFKLCWEFCMQNYKMFCLV